MFTIGAMSGAFPTNLVLCNSVGFCHIELYGFSWDFKSCSTTGNAGRGEMEEYMFPVESVINCHTWVAENEST